MKKAGARKLAGILVVALGLTALGSVAGWGQEAEKFFESKVIEFYYPYSPDGGFDTYSRTIAKYLSNYLPVKAVVVKNVTGERGLAGTNQLYAAPGDGLTIGIVNGGGMIFNQVMGIEGVKYDLAKMSWLGRVVAEPHVIAVGVETPYYTIDDMQQAKETIVLSTTGTASDEYLGAAIIAEALGFSLRQVVGQWCCSVYWRGQDADGTEATMHTLLPLVKSRDIRPVLQIGLERDSRLLGVPTALEVVFEGKKDMVVAITNAFAFGRAIGGPPGIPQDRVKLLREALDKVFHDEAFIQEMEKRGRPIISLGGEQMAELIKDAMAAAGKIEPVLKKAVGK